MWYNILYMRVSNEPCTDRPTNARRELAHLRAFVDLNVYGECRDSEQLKAANLSAWQFTPRTFGRNSRMKKRNILIGLLSALCVILIALIAFLSVRILNIADSSSGSKAEVHTSAGSGSKGEKGTDGGSKPGRPEEKSESDAGSEADRSRGEGTVKNGEDKNGGSTAGESSAQTSGTNSSGVQGSSGETASGEYEIDGVLYMGDGRPVYEYLDPPQDSVIDYCPFDTEEFIDAVAAVYQTAHDNEYEYGNSNTLPPCEDGFIACDRLIARALWDLGYTDQPHGGMQIASGGLTEEQFLTTHGFIKINDQYRLMRGDIVLQDDGKDGVPAYTWHTFVLVDYDPETQMCSKYDCGHFTPEGQDRVSSEQPFTCPLADFGDQRRFVCAFRIRSAPEPAE